MKETKLQPNEIDIIQSNNGLKLYLSGLLTGSSATPRSSLYNIEGKTEMLEPDEILHRWQEQLNNLSSASDFEKEVFQFDSAQLSKWGPQGQVAPISELLDEIVYPSFEEQAKPSAFSSDEWKLAKRQVVKALHRYGCRGLTPVPYHRVVDDMRARDTLESNSGWPLFTRRNKPEVIAQSIQEAEDGRWKTYPAIALFRNYNMKTRLVWMFPMSANLVEGSYFQPLQSILMKSQAAEQFLAPWKGFEQVRKNISEAYSSHQAIAASDFSSTDAHFKLAASMEVFDVLKECFQPRYRDGLRESIEYMHKIPLIIGPDSELVGEHGVSSGSNWTNFIETIFDYIFAIYVTIKELARKGYTLQNTPKGRFWTLVYRGLYAIGDDMSWHVDKPNYDADFSKRLEEYGKSVGQLVKAEKTTNYPDKVKSLQRLFQAGYFQSGSDYSVRAVYPTIRALKSLVYPERMHKKKDWSRDMAAIRAFMILENCIDHPLFEQFCDFVANGDPHLVEFAHYAAGKQNAIFRKSKLVTGLNPTYNQEKRNSRITEFASVQYLATK
jgi:hypothetical protein